MTPSAVKTYLCDRKVAPLKDIAIHFDMEPDAIRGLLSHWIRKGRVKMYQGDACQNGNCCGGCSGHSEKEVYEWLQ
ncbi:FeoC like transcriptional regulator [Malonomonas rubra DSM 5091]|uniref:FeoC like transcriptional regulator n=1 Tax=Malonomonas rubra DSM 5091 TaxID=1122189 RepID=A0A1M6DJH4_MALRU|nr:FeoC-like transcriptional regulator [Malonomonas rubra]SHI73454.1 FeoC like transcriptional regulator [Malonomonas rubra DSM 5091]